MGTKNECLSLKSNHVAMQNECDHYFTNVPKTGDLRKQRILRKCDQHELVKNIFFILLSTLNDQWFLLFINTSNRCYCSP